MKIGILTYHRSHNYGALLQAVALRVALESMGNEVYYIDYFPEYHRRMYMLFDWQSFRGTAGLKKRTKYLYRVFQTLLPKMVRRHSFEAFINKWISPYCVSMKESFDCVIYGSDQIWRKQPFINDYNPFYFGLNDLKTRIHATYAASLSSLPETKDDTDHFCALVAYLDKISVRERSIKDFLSEYIIKDIHIDVDPCLLLSKERWASLIPNKELINERYILLYDLQSDYGIRVFNEEEVQGFAERNCCSLVRVRAVASRRNDIFDRHSAGPEDFINLIRNATCVVTSSYHGVVLSLVFDRPFLCSFSKNSQRALDLMNEVGLKSCILEPGHAFPYKVSSLEHNSLNVLHSLINQSNDYLSHLDEVSGKLGSEYLHT